MEFRPSKEMKITLLPEQEKLLSSKEKIALACRREDVMAFDIYAQEALIGFALVRKFDDGVYFLWDYAIDCRLQNRGYGTAALREFIDFMRDTYQMTEMVTTYVWGNDHAKHVYETVGFTETDVVDEDDCHEVNMRYLCQ